MDLNIRLGMLNFVNWMNFKNFLSSTMNGLIDEEGNRLIFRPHYDEKILNFYLLGVFKFINTYYYNYYIFCYVIRPESARVPSKWR